MNLRQNESTRTMQASAKLNLYLEVLGRREDGYHELQTLLLPVRLFDSLAFAPLAALPGGEPGPIDLEVRCSRPGLGSDDATETSVPTGTENLVVRALELLRRRTGCTAGARVELVKRIPSRAGLGGGSSDAAAALQLANRGWQLGLDEERLTELAAELGSDVPFFLGRGAAICRGRGEQVTRLPAVAPLDFVIVKPPEGLSTADVYRVLDAPSIAAGDRRVEKLSPSLHPLLGALRCGSRGRLARSMANRLQSAAAGLSPWVDRVAAACAGLDFIAHQLSGSGTAYFGLCRHPQHARRLAAILRTNQLGLVYVTRSCH